MRLEHLQIFHVLNITQFLQACAGNCEVSSSHPLPVLQDHKNTDKKLKPQTGTRKTSTLEIH